MKPNPAAGGYHAEGPWHYYGNACDIEPACEPSGEGEERTMDDPNCPLHSPTSRHAE